jgi:hypothetical protein
MRVISVNFLCLLGICAFGLLSQGCQPTPGNVNTNINANTAVSNTASNLSNANLTTTSGPTIDTREPEQYQATVKLSFQASGDQQTTTLPTIAANVARSGNDRVMEFNLPNNEKVIYLDKGGSNYLILPNRRQYAEINQQSVGFDVRRLMMPENIVNQVKNMQGVQRLGEETVNGRRITRYAFSSTANTQTQAGNVDTQSYILVDNETGLPLRSETVSQTQSGGNVQGYKNMRLVTEMTDIKNAPDANLFNVPTDYAKIEPEQVRAQMNLLFQALSAIVGQMVQQSQGTAAPASNANTAATPANR